jgi:hypothetical protein
MVTGFDASSSVVWLLDGVLSKLPPAVAHKLLRDIASVSRLGSVLVMHDVKLQRVEGAGKQYRVGFNAPDMAGPSALPAHRAAPLSFSHRVQSEMASQWQFGIQDPVSLAMSYGFRCLSLLDPGQTANLPPGNGNADESGALLRRLLLDLVAEDATDLQKQAETSAHLLRDLASEHMTFALLAEFRESNLRIDDEFSSVPSRALYCQ